VPSPKRFKHSRACQTRRFQSVSNTNGAHRHGVSKAFPYDWRIFAYLAVVTVDGDKPFGRGILARLADAVRIYR